MEDDSRLHSFPDNADAVERLAGATGRRTSKSLRNNRGEAVWPPLVEATLIEALEVYRPATSGNPEQMTRFPNRNRFIADYIYEHTRKRRTPKQVGSRIQQLRDTCSDPDIKHLLSRKVYPDKMSRSSSMLEGIISRCSSSSSSPPPPSSSRSHRVVSLASSTFSSDSSSSGPSFSCSADSSRHSSASSEYSDITPTKFNNAMRIANPPLSFADNRRWQSGSNQPPTGLNLSITSVSTDPPLTHITITTSRPLSEVDNAVRFTSEVPLTPDTHYCVFAVRQGEEIMHLEDTSLMLVSTSTTDGNEPNFTYSVNLVPLYWSKLGSYDLVTLDQFTIVQEIKRASTPITGSVLARPSGDAIALKVIYEFKHPAECESELSAARLYSDTQPILEFSPPEQPCSFSDLSVSFDEQFSDTADSSYYHAAIQQQQCDGHGRHDYMVDSQPLHGGFYDHSSGYSPGFSAVTDWSAMNAAAALQYHYPTTNQQFNDADSTPFSDVLYPTVAGPDFVHQM